MVITCGHCGIRVEAIATNSGMAAVQFLRCPNCNGGSVKTSNGPVYPPAAAGGNVKNLPQDVEMAWQEARTAHAVAAYTAADHVGTGDEGT